MRSFLLASWDLTDRLAFRGLSLFIVTLHGGPLCFPACTSSSFMTNSFMYFSLRCWISPCALSFPSGTYCMCVVLWSSWSRVLFFFHSTMKLFLLLTVSDWSPFRLSAKSVLHFSFHVSQRLFYFCFVDTENPKESATLHSPFRLWWLHCTSCFWQEHNPFFFLT